MHVKVKHKKKPTGGPSSSPRPVEEFDLLGGVLVEVGLGDLGSWEFVARGLKGVRLLTSLSIVAAWLSDNRNGLDGCIFLHEHILIRFVKLSLFRL